METHPKYMHVISLSSFELHMLESRVSTVTYFFFVNTLTNMRQQSVVVSSIVEVFILRRIHDSNYQLELKFLSISYHCMGDVVSIYGG